MVIPLTKLFQSTQTPLCFLAILVTVLTRICLPALFIALCWSLSLSPSPQIHSRYEGKDISKHKRNLVIAGGVTLSVIVSPVVAAVTVGKRCPFPPGCVVPKHSSRAMISVQ